MTLADKISTLTLEQKEKFKVIQDSTGLESFLSETGLELTPEEKTEVLNYIKTSKLPLSDEDLEKVAAGYPRPGIPDHLRYGSHPKPPEPKPDFTGRQQPQK